MSFGQAHTSISTSWYYREQNSSSNSEESSLACFQKQAQKVVDMKGGEKEDLFKRATVNRGNYRRSTKEHHQQLFNSGMLLLSLELPLNHFQSGNLLNRLNQWCCQSVGVVVLVARAVVVVIVLYSNTTILFSRGKIVDSDLKKVHSYHLGILFRKKRFMLDEMF